MLHGSVSMLKFNVMYTPRVQVLRAVLFGTSIWRQSSWIWAKSRFPYFALRKVFDENNGAVHPGRDCNPAGFEGRVAVGYAVRVLHHPAISLRGMVSGYYQPSSK